MYIEDWDSFFEQVEALYRADPLRTRYVTKYRHCDGKLVLKVTDDRVCLKFLTDQLVDVKKVEKLNNLFFKLMACGADAADAQTPKTPEAQKAVEMQRSRKSRRARG